MADPTVKIVITADGSQAGREVDKTGAELTKIGAVSVTVGNLLADLGRRAVAVGKDLASFPLDAAIATGHYAQQLENLTTETGLSADEQQAYTVVLNRAGLGVQELSSIWRLLSQNVIAARDPLSEAALNFRRLGIELTGSEGPSEVLRLVAERLSALPDGFQKNTLAVQLLGRGAAQILPAFRDGLTGASEAAKHLGSSLNDDARVKALAFDTQLADLNLASQGFTHQVGALMAPALTDLGLHFTDVTAKASKLVAEMNAATNAGQSLGSVLMRTLLGRSPVPGSPPGETFGPPSPAGTAGAPSGEDFGPAGARQAELGRRIVRREQQKQFDKAHMAELNPALADTFNIDTVQAREKVDESSRARPDLTGMNALQKGLVAIRDLMPELNADQALERLNQNLDDGHKIVVTNVSGWQSYRDGLGDAAESARVLEAQQTELYQSGSADLGAADAARRVSFARLEAEEAQKRQTILDTFGESARGQQKLTDLENDSATQRMAIVRRFPTFFEQQMQSIVQSNAFSVSTIISTWTGGVASAIVNNQHFIQAAVKSTELAIVQGALNTGVQLIAQWGLQASVELGILTATEASKLGLKTATNATIVAGDAAAAGTTVGIWGGAGLAISGFFAETLAGFEAMVGTMVATVSAVGVFVMGVLSAIAGALTLTVFGIPWAGAIIVGIVLIAAALAATGNLGFREGGIGNFGGGTQAMLHGQEAIIPLDGRGARFMNQLGFGGGRQTMTINVPVMLDGRQIALATARHTPMAWRNQGAPI